MSIIQKGKEIESLGKQVKWFLMGICPEIHCQKIIEIHIGYYAGVTAKGRAEQYNGFIYYGMWIRKAVNFPVQDNPIPDSIRVVVKVTSFYKVAYKISYLKPVVATR